MPNAAIVGAALTDHSAHPYSLFLDATDLIGQPSRGFGVDIRTITVNEVGPGGVSSISFTIDDPSKLITVNNGQVIRFVWNTHPAGAVADEPLFLGFVDSFSLRPDFGMQGRSIDIQGIGIEALLDWKIVPAYAAAVSGALPEQVSLVGAAAGISSITSGSVSPAQSSLTQPVGGYNRGALDATIALMPFSSYTVGVPLRQLLQAMIDSVTKYDQQPALSGASQIRVLFTIDFYGQLRMWNDYPTTAPDDYRSDSFDVTASEFVENLEFTTDPSQIVHEVWVTGSGAAATPTLYDDGTGIKGRQIQITDTTITTASGALQAAQAVFQANSNQVRGSYERNDWDPVDGPAGHFIRAGSLVTMVDPSVSLNAPVNGYRIMEIEKTFNGSGRQNWKVSFGSLAPSAIRDIRRLTRTTLN
jgi:hypothetical protein